MTKPWSYISLFGEAFSPAEAERTTGLTFDSKREPGVLWEKGPRKGEPYGFAFATLHAPEDLSEPEQFDWLLTRVGPHMEKLHSLGVTDGKFHVTYAFDAQCNLEFEPAFIARLAELGLAFTVTCYQDEAEFEGQRPVAG